MTKNNTLRKKGTPLLFNFRNSNIYKLLSIIVLVLGVGTGIILVQQQQNVGEKADDAPIPFSCTGITTESACTTAPECAWYACEISPEYRSCQEQGTPLDSVCCPEGEARLGQCGEACSAATCPSTQLGLWSCWSDRGYVCITCVDNDICKTPSPPSNDDDYEDDNNASDDVSNNECGGYNENPSSFTVNNSGTLDMRVKSSYSLVIALKVNSDTCGENDNDTLLETGGGEIELIETNLSVSQGDGVCVYIRHEEGLEYPAAGWIEPEGNICVREGDEYKIDDLIAASPNASSIQCWGDYDPGQIGCDFNDFAISFSTGNTISTSFKIAFEGINTKALDQEVEARLIQNNNEIWSEITVIQNDDNGIYTLPIGENISYGEYDLLVKGYSHLQKRYRQIIINEDSLVVDLTQNPEDFIIAGDVNHDNTITIADIARVSKYYTELARLIDPSDTDMIDADITKDGYITIQDLALVAINWIDFIVKGDE